MIKYLQTNNYNNKIKFLLNIFIGFFLIFKLKTKLLRNLLSKISQVKSQQRNCNHMLNHFSYLTVNRLNTLNKQGVITNNSSGFMNQSEKIRVKNFSE